MFDGRHDEGHMGFREALGGLRDSGFEFELARVALDMVMLLGPAEPEILSAAEEARSIFERLGARPYLKKLDAALLLADGPGATTPSAKVATP
jgi:hypothetical protein